jgi:hypothetical protein
MGLGPESFDLVNRFIVTQLVQRRGGRIIMFETFPIHQEHSIRPSIYDPATFLYPTPFCAVRVSKYKYH